MLLGVDSYKVKTIIHDVEDDVVVLTVARVSEPTVLGIPCSEAVEVVEDFFRLGGIVDDGETKGVSCVPQ